MSTPKNPESLDRAALSFNQVSLVLFIAGLALAMIGIASSIITEHLGWGIFAAAGSCISSAITLFFFAQMFYIRSTLEAIRRGPPSSMPDDAEPALLNDPQLERQIEKFKAS
jgi:hypothetical protein